MGQIDQVKQALVVRIARAIQQDRPPFQLQRIDQGRLDAVQRHGPDPFGPVGGQPALARTRRSVKGQDRTGAVRPARQYADGLGVAVRRHKGLARKRAFQRQTQLFGVRSDHGALRGHEPVIAEAETNCAGASCWYRGAKARPVDGIRRIRSGRGSACPP